MSKEKLSSGIQQRAVPKLQRRRKESERYPRVEYESSDQGDDEQFGDLTFADPNKGYKRFGKFEDHSVSKKSRKEPVKRSRAARRTSREREHNGSNNIYEKLQGKCAVITVVDEWIEVYQQDKDTALLLLMDFFFQCSGCRANISQLLPQSMDFPEIVRQLTLDFEESKHYPLVAPGRHRKTFYSNFCDFVQMLVQQCQYDLVFDDVLMDNVMSQLTLLSGSQVRAFRHTATLAVMKLMTALVNVAFNLNTSLENVKCQIETEMQKTGGRQTATSLEQLANKRQELESNMEEMGNMLTYMFKFVFVQRYRDIVPEIRSICMAEMGQWMKIFHQNILEDDYLKYLGWTLHDKVGDVRLKCLQALQPLYSSEELSVKLGLFTMKFKDRIIAMTLDKDVEVAAQAVKIVSSMFRYHRSALSYKDCEVIYNLVYASDSAVAHAAGELVNEQLFTSDESETKPNQSAFLLRDVVQFFIESELPEHGAYLVDSLIGLNPIMKDWTCMTNLLLSKLPPDEDFLDDVQETCLVKIMVFSVQQAATGKPPAGRHSNQMNLTAKQLKQVQDDKIKVTDYFIGALPLLLKKFLTDSDKVAKLILIPQYFDWNMIGSSREDEVRLAALLNLTNKIVEEHEDKEVLDGCSKLYEMLPNDESTFQMFANSRNNLLDKLVENYQNAWKKFSSCLAQEKHISDDLSLVMMTSTKKLAAFCSNHDVEKYNLWNSWLSLIQDDVVLKSVNGLDIIKYVLGCCHLTLQWHLAKIDPKNPNEEEMDTLWERLCSFLKICQEKLLSISELEEEVFASICDLLIIFSPQLDEDPLMTSLVYKPDKVLQKQLSNFIQNNVFVVDDDDDDDTKIEKLHQRRLLLASFLKLIVYNVVSFDMAIETFSLYDKFNEDYGDIIKATLEKGLEINQVNCATTMVYCLILLFKNLVSNSSRGVAELEVESFFEIKKLAKRFSLAFIRHKVKYRVGVVALHQQGIRFSCIKSLANKIGDVGDTPTFIEFLEILSVFSCRLIDQDKRVVWEYLKRKLIHVPPQFGDVNERHPLLIYQISLGYGRDQAPLQWQYRHKSKLLSEEEGE